jgi:hypothetical protein
MSTADAGTWGTPCPTNWDDTAIDPVPCVGNRQCSTFDSSEPDAPYWNLTCNGTRWEPHYYHFDPALPGCTTNPGSVPMCQKDGSVVVSVPPPSGPSCHDLARMAAATTNTVSQAHLNDRCLVDTDCLTPAFTPGVDGCWPLCGAFYGSAQLGELLKSTAQQACVPFFENGCVIETISCTPGYHPWLDTSWTCDHGSCRPIPDGGLSDAGLGSDGNAGDAQ